MKGRGRRPVREHRLRQAGFKTRGQQTCFLDANSFILVDMYPFILVDMYLYIILCIYIYIYNFFVCLPLPLPPSFSVGLYVYVFSEVRYEQPSCQLGSRNAPTTHRICSSDRSRPQMIEINTQNLLTRSTPEWCRLGWVFSAEYNLVGIEPKRLDSSEGEKGVSMS